MGPKASENRIEVRKTHDPNPRPVTLPNMPPFIFAGTGGIAMFQLLQHLEALQFSLTTVSLGTGLMLGVFVGATTPLPEPSSPLN